MHFSRGLLAVKSRLNKSSDLRASLSVLVIPLGLPFVGMEVLHIQLQVYQYSFYSSFQNSNLFPHLSSPVDKITQNQISRSPVLKILHPQ